MPNEFVARLGLIALANSSISGSLTISGGITGSFSGSLVGSASYAVAANSASYALTASYVSQVHQLVPHMLCPHLSLQTQYQHHSLVALFQTQFLLLQHLMLQQHHLL